MRSGKPQNPGHPETGETGRRDGYPGVRGAQKDRREAHREEHAPLWDQLLRRQEGQDGNVATGEPPLHPCSVRPGEFLALEVPSAG